MYLDFGITTLSSYRDHIFSRDAKTSPRCRAKIHSLRGAYTGYPDMSEWQFQQPVSAAATGAYTTGAIHPSAGGVQMQMPNGIDFASQTAGLSTMPSGNTMNPRANIPSQVGEAYNTNSLVMGTPQAQFPNNLEMGNHTPGLSPISHPPGLSTIASGSTSSSLGGSPRYPEPEQTPPPNFNFSSQPIVGDIGQGLGPVPAPVNFGSPLPLQTAPQQQAAFSGLSQSANSPNATVGEFGQVIGPAQGAPVPMVQQQPTLASLTQASPSPQATHLQPGLGFSPLSGPEDPQEPGGNVENPLQNKSKSRKVDGMDPEKLKKKRESDKRSQQAARLRKQQELETRNAQIEVLKKDLEAQKRRHEQDMAMIAERDRQIEEREDRISRQETLIALQVAEIEKLRKQVRDERMME